MVDYLMLALLGGFLALDERAGWQGLLSQPLFGAVAVGLITGELWVGVQTGFLLELVWFSRLPMRGTRRMDQTAAVIVGAGSACFLVHRTGDPWIEFIVGLSTFLGLLASVAAVWILKPVDSAWENRLARFESSRGALASGIARIHGLRLFTIYVSEAAVVMVLLPPALELASWMSIALRGAGAGGVEFWGMMLPVFGIVALVQIYWHRFSLRFLFASIGITLLVLIRW